MLKHTFSSGIECTILPFPALRYEKLQKAMLDKYPLPKPPKKKIKVADGEETIDDTTNEKYLEKKQAIERERNRWLSGKMLTIAMRDCIDFDLDEYEPIIQELENDLGETYPDNPVARKVEFVKDYVVRGKPDFLALITLSQKLMTITAEEVSTQVDDVFPGEVAQSTGNGTETPGSDEVKSLDV